MRLASSLLAAFLTFFTFTRAARDNIPPVSFIEFTRPSSTVEAQNQAQSQASAFSHGNAVGIASGTPNDVLPDPCGPPTQAPAAANSLSTCNKTVSVSDLDDHSYYGVNCQNNTTKPALDPATCELAMYTTCYQISNGYSPYDATNKWIWSTEEGACTFGYWLPEGGAPAPSFERCFSQIYSLMSASCKGPTYNVGSVNLADGNLPNGLVTGSIGTGAAVNAEYPSYVMFPLSSYYGINGD